MKWRYATYFNALIEWLKNVYYTNNIYVLDKFHLKK